jgi:WD40 repeat protein
MVSCKLYLLFHTGSIFASGSTDKKVKIWDLMRVGFEIPKDLGGTDELLVSLYLYSLLIKATKAQ